MPADLLPLPPPVDKLPEGWAAGRFAHEWDRAGYARDGSAPLLIVHQRRARVYEASFGDPERGFMAVWVPGTHKTLHEAIAAVEAAYCNARVRR